MADWDVVSQDPAPAGAPPANGGNTSWVPVSQEVAAPQVLRQMPDFKSENDYQGWVRQHTDGQGNFQPNDSDPSTPQATVDPYGNGSTVDLRRMYKENAAVSPITGQYELEPTTAQMEKYQTKDSPILTKNSMYAAGAKPSQLGTWDTDDDGSHVYRAPGWVPPSTTEKVMNKAVDVATKGGHDIVSAVTDPDFYDPEKAIDNAADFGASALKGLGGTFHGALEDVNLLGGAFPVLYDKAASLFSGKDTTDAQDAWFRNTVDPLKDQDEAFSLAKNAGLPDKVAHTFGEALGTISEAILTGGESTALPAAASGTDAAVAAITHGTKAMAVPATQSAIDTGQKVYQETGDANKALKAAQVQWLVTSAGGYVPLSAGGTLPSRLVQGAVAGTISGETGREAMNTVLPPAMQQTFDPENMTMEALSGAAMGGLGGHGGPDNTPLTKDLPTPGEMGAAGQRLSPGSPGSGPGPALVSGNINENMYNAYHQAWSAADRGDMHIADPIVDKFKAAAQAARATADANPGDAQMDAAATQAEKMASALDEKVNKTAQNRAQQQPSAPNKRAATQAKVNLIAQTADDSGEIKVEASDDGHVVTVNDRRVANFQTKAAAETAADDARQAVDDRRVDSAMRKKVGDMTSDEMKQELLTHPLTGIPNRRAYEESDKLPAQVSVDANSLKWINDEGGHAAGDHLLKAIATALHDETPNAYHFGGDEFVVQAKDHATAAAIMDRAKQRLAGATIEMENAAGHKITLKGIGISHGISSDLGSADRALQSDKQRQESAGLRAARGEQPPGAHIAAPEAGLPGEQGVATEDDAGTSRVLGQPTSTPAQPTAKQAEAGNYAKGEVRYHGLPIAVENVEGQYRTGKGDDGKTWRNRLKGADYGYFKGTKANDGDGVDVFMGKQPDNGHAYVIDQLDKTGKKFDEHKVVVGVKSAEEAKALYLRHYEKGWKGFGGVTELPLEDFKKWLKFDSHEGPLDRANVPQPRAARGAGPDARHDSILQFLARHPRGLDSEEAAAQGVDAADMRLPSAVVGIKRAFRKGGMSFDHAAETLHQEGYPVVDSHGQYNPNTLLDKISDELRGRAHYSVHNESNIPEASDLQQWRHAKTDAELGAMDVDELERLHAQLEAASERAAIQREHEHVAEPDLDNIPFAKGKPGGQQQDLFGNHAAIQNELKRVEAELDRKRNSGQESVETGRPDDLFSQARKQTTFLDITEHPIETKAPKGETKPAVAETKPAQPGTLAARLETIEKELGISTPVKTPIKTGEKQRDIETDLVDAGEKIGGARKDKWAERGLSLADLKDMGAGEAANLVKKAAIWKPDYEAMINGGADTRAAALVKMMYDKLGSEPRENTPVGREHYVEAMQALRQISETVKTVDDARAIQDKFLEAIGYDRSKPYYAASEGNPGYPKFWSIHKGRKGVLDVNYKRLHEAEKLIEKGWPNIEPWQRRFNVRQDSSGNFHVMAKTSYKSLGSFKTKAEAAAFAKSQYEGLSKGEKKATYVRPHLDHIKRTGPAVLSGDAKPMDFIQDFGFRGLEFGNWAANDERQKLVNHAYEALHDLARTLGIPPKALSLNGQLGLALGARGGGFGVAHYEPGKLVINMTKINGAGSMAHEWGHAVDHYFGEFGRPDAYTTQARGASGWYKDPTVRTLEHLRPEMQQAWQGVMKAIFQRDLTQAEHIRGMELANEKRQATLDQQKQRQTVAEGRPAGQRDEKFIRNNASWIRDAEKSLDRARDLLEERRALPAEPGTYGKTGTRYTKEAGDRGDYWRRPTELFARAFESYVHDKMQASGELSQYLVHSTPHEDPYPGEDRPAINAAMQKLVDTFDTRSEGDKEVLFRSGDGAKAPGGMDEAKIAAAVHQFLDKFEVPVGGVRVAKDMAELLKDPEIGPILKRAGADAANTDHRIAFVHPRTGKMYFVADQIHSLDHVASLVAHEYITHFGLRAAFGNSRAPEYQAILDGVVKAMPADVRKRGLREFGPAYNHMDQKQRNVAAEEALAYYGQRYADGQSVPARLSRWIDRAVAMIRDWLRNVMGLPKKFDELFIKRTLGDLEAFLRRSRSTSGAGAASHEPAFAGKQDTFYSGLAKAVDAAKREKGTGAEWEATLRNMPGVKAEEMQWTGIKDWLEGRGKVSKAEVAEYVAAHQVHLDEVHLGEPRNLSRYTDEIKALGFNVEEGYDGDPMLEPHGFDPNINDEQILLNEEKALQLLKEMQGGGGIGPQHISEINAWLRGHGMDDLDHESETALMAGGQSADEQIEHLHRYGYPVQDLPDPAAQTQHGITKYQNYATPGGTNYRELLMRLEPRGLTLDEAQEHEELTKLLRSSIPSDQREALVNRRIAIEEGAGMGVKHQSPHWDHPNVLAHIRFDDRTGPNGEKILHVHELQSDWHQAGRKKGYNTPKRAPPTDAEVHRFFALRENANYTPEMLDQYRQEMMEHPDFTARNGVAEAPFKTTWPELAMKRMLRMAAEGGYDKLSWDTGSTNAERYNMQRVADRIAIQRDGGDEYRMTAMKDDKLVQEGRSMSEEQLVNYIGKEMAQKAISDLNSGKVMADFRGEDLKVGGAGMRGFYDNILPKTVGKLVKKWGSSVEPARIGSPDTAVPKYEVAQQSGKWIAYNPLDQYDFKEFATAEDAQAFVAGAGHAERYVVGQDTDKDWRVIDTQGREQFASGAHEDQQAAQVHADTLNLREVEGRLQVHMVDITTQMRDSVMEGQPMFAKGDVEDRRTDDDRLFGREGAGGKAYGLVRRAAGSLVDNRLVGDIAKILNPKDISAFSKEAAMRTSAFIGELAHQKQVAQEHLQQFARAVNKLSPNDQLAMIHAIETGAPQPIAAMQPVADALRKMLDTWRDNVRALGEGHLENFIDNYFPHWWRDQKNAASVFASIQGRRTMSGPKTFLKKRVIPTTKEGIEYGLKPITTNPLVLTLLKIHEMQRFISGVTMMRAYKDAGLAKFVPATKSVDEGWKEINDPIARVSSWSEEEGGFIQRGRYAMPEDAARIVNNHLSKSALSDFAPAQAIRTASNILNSMQLGFSAFHLGFTTMDAMVSKNALALERLFAGEPIKALAAFAEGVTPAGAIMNVARGLKLMRAYTNPAGATPDMKALVNALTAGGGRVHMDRFYLANEGVSPFRGVGPRSLMEDMKMALTQPHGKVAAATKAIGSFPVEYAQELWNGLAEVAKIYPAWQLPFEMLGRTTRASSAWIMEHLVPMQKLGVFADMANDFLRRNPNATPEEVANSMQAAWRSVDNRMGEMVYDNLYWNRTFKDAAHLSMRAVGWNWGDWREIGGAPFELLKNINDGIRDGKMPKLGHKSAYVMGLIFTQALIGAFLGYMYGQPPKSLKDYMFPRTGRFQEDGTPERVSLPSYVKDIYEYYMHPVDTVAHKANPWIGLVWDEVQDLDYFGHPIYNPSDSEREEWIERLTYAAKAFRPFSWTGQKQMVGAWDGSARGTAAGVSPYFGLTPAPGLVTKPEKMAEFEHYKQEKAWKDKLKFDLKQAQKSGDKAAVKEVQKKLNDLRPAEVKERAQYLHDKAKAKKDAAAGKTSAIMDKVGPLIDSSTSRAEMAQKIHAAGYPALAGLIGSLPDQLRPQVADAIEREAT